MKKQSTWFSHDSNASLDPKLIALTATHGIAGYGRWWRLVEILRSEEQYRYNITTPFAYTVLAKELICTTDEAKQFIQDCIDQYQLLQTDDQYIWSTSLCGRMEFWDNKKSVLSEAGKRGAQTKRSKQQASLEPPLNQAEATLKPRAANKTKQKETKQNTTTETATNNSSPLESHANEKSSSGGGGRADGVCASGVCPPKEVAVAEATWQKHKANSLANDNFTYAIISTGKLTMTQLGHWLDAFNRILTIRGEAPKSEQDYRMHFLNWFKFRDPAKEDPHTFLTPEPRNKAPTIINTQTFLKTPQQIEEEQRAQQEQWKTRMAK